MADPEENILEDLIDDIMDRYYEPESYDPDEFHQKATDFLSLYGYNLKREFVWEVHESDPVDEVEGYHLEIISEFEDREDTEYLRFTLEDGRTGNEPPSIDRVEEEDDFDLKTKYD